MLEETKQITEWIRNIYNRLLEKYIAKNNENTIMFLFYSYGLHRKLFVIRGICEYRTTRLLPSGSKDLALEDCHFGYKRSWNLNIKSDSGARCTLESIPTTLLEAGMWLVHEILIFISHIFVFLSWSPLSSIPSNISFRNYPLH